MPLTLADKVLGGVLAVLTVVSIVALVGLLAVALDLGGARRVIGTGDRRVVVAGRLAGAIASLVVFVVDPSPLASRLIFSVPGAYLLAAVAARLVTQAALRVGRGRSPRVAPNRSEAQGTALPGGSLGAARVGVGGALLVFILGIVAAGLANVSWMEGASATVVDGARGAHRLHPLVAPVILLSTLWGYAAVFCLFWFRDRRGPWAARSFMVVYLLSGLAVLLLAAAKQDGARRDPLIWIASAALYNAVWQPYFSRSRRVRATYHAGLPRRPGVAFGQIGALAVGVWAAGMLAAGARDVGRIWRLDASRALVRLDDDAERPPGQAELEETVDRLRDRLDARGLSAGQVRGPEAPSAPIEVIYLHPRDSGGPPPRWVLRRGVLEFVEVLEGPFPTEAEAKRAQLAHAGARLLRSAEPSAHIYLCPREPLLDNGGVAAARLDRDLTGAPAVRVEFTEIGARALRKFTAASAGRRLAIVLDEVVLSAPVIRGEIGQRGQITLTTLEEAVELEALLSSGRALPRALRVVEFRALPSRVPWLVRRSLRLAASSVPPAILLAVAVAGFVWLGATERRATELRIAVGG